MVDAGDGVRLRTWTTGTATGLPAVVLIHGGPGLWDYLEPVAGLLDPVTTVHRYDQRGCGGSEKSDEHTFARYVADLESLRRHWAHESWVVIGHSFGATLALEYALAHPARVRALGYLSGVGSGDWRTPYRRERAARMTAEQQRRLAELEESRSPAEEAEFRALCWFTDHADPEDGLRWAYEDARVDLPINFTANRALMAEADGLPHAAGLLHARNLGMPCWFLHGDRDPRSSRNVADLASTVSGAGMHLIPGAGHHPWREKPDHLRILLLSLLQALPLR